MKTFSFTTALTLSLCIILSFFVINATALDQTTPSPAAASVGEKTAVPTNSSAQSTASETLAQPTSSTSTSVTQTGPQSTASSTPSNTSATQAGTQGAATTPPSTAATPAPAGPQPIGQIVWVTGTIKAVSASKNIPERFLDRRSPVYLHDTILSDDKSTCQIVFSDNSSVSMRANTVFRIDEYEFGKDVPKGKSKFVASIIKGGFRTITGLIPKDNPESYKVKTPVATIAVQGTQYEAVHTLKEKKGAKKNEVEENKNLTESVSSTANAKTTASMEKNDGESSAMTSPSTQAIATSTQQSNAKTEVNAKNESPPTTTESAQTTPANTTNENESPKGGKTVVGQIEGHPVVTTGGKTFTLSDTNKYVAVPDLGAVVQLPAKPPEFSQPTRMERAIYSPANMNMTTRPVHPIDTNKTSTTTGPAGTGPTSTGGSPPSGGGASGTGGSDATGSGSSSKSSTPNSKTTTTNFCIM